MRGSASACSGLKGAWRSLYQVLCGKNESVLVRLHSSCCRFGDRRGLRFGIEQWARSQAEHGIQLLVGTRHPPLTSTLLFRIEPLTLTPLLNCP